ncbi:MAG: 4Fe-4S dicluster domain-containing protein [Bacteroidales bacterium]|nr:4Fe-4S dicluster domain-containing protein [Bacteroidales bacterium]
MIPFGFSLSPSSVTDLDKVDTRRYRELLRLEPGAATCIGCGSCSATCTSSAWTGMSVRKVILGLQRGRDVEVDAMLRGCMLCGKCTMVCPRGINTRNLILAAMRISKEDGK